MKKTSMLERVELDIYNLQRLGIFYALDLLMDAISTFTVLRHLNQSRNYKNHATEEDIQSQSQTFSSITTTRLSL